MTSLPAALRQTGDPRGLVIGQVKAVDVGAARLTVTVHGGDVWLPAAGGVYAVDDLVLIARLGRFWWVIAQIGTAPAPDPESQPAAPPAPDDYREAAITARETHTYRNGWRTDTHDLFQGDAAGSGYNTGCAFYGSAVSGLHADPSGSQTEIVLRMKRLAAGSNLAQAPTLWTVAESVKPAGAPTLLTSFAGPALLPGQEGTVVVPAARAEELLAGTAGGIACYVPPTNLLSANASSMETSVAAWAAGGSVPPALSSSTTHPHAGTKGLLVTWGTGGSLPIAATTVSGLTIGRVYTATAWVWVPTGSPHVFLVANSFLGHFTAVKNAHVQIRVTFTASSTSHQIQVWPGSAPTSGQQVWVDDVSVIENTYLQLAGRAAYSAAMSLSVRYLRS